MSAANLSGRSIGSHTHTDGCRHHRPVNLFGYEFSSDDDSGFELESGEVIYSDEEDSSTQTRVVEQSTLLSGDIDYSRFEAPPERNFPLSSAVDGNDTETNDDLELGSSTTTSATRGRAASVAYPQNNTPWYRRLFSIAFPPSSRLGYARIDQQANPSAQANANRRKRSKKERTPVQLQWSWICTDPLLFFRNVPFSQLASFWFWLDLAKRMIFSVPIVLVTLLIVYDVYYFNTEYASITSLPIVSYLSPYRYNTDTNTQPPAAAAPTFASFAFVYAILSSLVTVWYYIFFDIAAVMTLLCYYRCWLTSAAVKVRAFVLSNDISSGILYSPHLHA